MGVFVRAVVYGFGFSLGVELFKRVSSQLGLETQEAKEAPASRTTSADPDPDDGGDDAAIEPA